MMHVIVSPYEPSHALTPFVEYNEGPHIHDKVYAKGSSSPFCSRLHCRKCSHALLVPGSYADGSFDSIQLPYGEAQNLTYLQDVDPML